MKSIYFFKIKPKTNTRKVCNKKKKLLHSFILKKEFSKKNACTYLYSLPKWQPDPVFAKEIEFQQF